MKLSRLFFGLHFCLVVKIENLENVKDKKLVILEKCLLYFGPLCNYKTVYLLFDLLNRICFLS